MMKLKGFLLTKNVTSKQIIRLKSNLLLVGSIITISPQGPTNGFVFDDSIGNLVGFNESLLWEEYNLPPNQVEILSFHNNFIESDIAQGMIFKGGRTDVFHKFTMDVDPGYIYIEKFGGGIQWYMMETKDFISSINLKIKKENGNLVSFNGQLVTFRLSIKEV